MGDDPEVLRARVELYALQIGVAVEVVALALELAARAVTGEAPDSTLALH